MSNDDKRAARAAAIVSQRYTYVLQPPAEVLVASALPRHERKLKRERRREEQAARMERGMLAMQREIAELKGLLLDLGGRGQSPVISAASGTDSAGGAGAHNSCQRPQEQAEPPAGGGPAAASEHAAEGEHAAAEQEVPSGA